MPIEVKSITALSADLMREARRLEATGSKTTEGRQLQVTVAYIAEALSVLLVKSIERQ